MDDHRPGPRRFRVGVCSVAPDAHNIRDAPTSADATPTSKAWPGDSAYQYASSRIGSPASAIPSSRPVKYSSTTGIPSVASFHVNARRLASW